MDKLSSFYKKYDKRIWVIFFTRIVTVAGYSLVMPFLSLYLHSELGVPMKIVGTIMMASMGVGAFANILGGELSDYFGRKQVMVYAFFLRAVVFIFIAYFVAIKVHFLVIAFFLILSAILGSLTMPASNAMLADVADPTKRMDAFGFIRIGANIGWSIGPAVGGLLATVSYSSLFLLTAVTSVAAGFMILFLVKESGVLKGEEEKVTVKDFFKIRHDRIFLWFCFFSLLIWVIRGQMTVALAIFGVDRIGITKIQLGYLFTLNGLLVVFLQYHTTKLTKKIKMTTALMIGSVLYAAGFLSVGFANTFLFLVLSMAIITIGEMALSPATMTLSANLSPKRQKGRYMGVAGLFENLGWSIAPFIGGILLDTFPGKSLSIWAIISLFGLAAAAGYYWIKNKIPAKIDLNL